MQEKKNIRLLIILAVLLLLTAFVYWIRQDQRGFEVDKAMFRVADLDQVDEIILESEKGRVVLKFDGVRWKVNDFVADRNMVEVLFATLAQMEPRRPVPLALRDSVSTKLEREGVHVTLLQAGNPIDEFMAGGNSQKTQAFLSRKGGTPYYMIIPGYRVYVSGIFELQPQEWRDKYVFGFNWRNFKSLAARFTENPQKNFKVSNQDGFFGLEGIKTDTTKLNDLMNHVFMLTVDQYVDATAFDDRDTLISLSIFDIGEREYTLTLFREDDNQQLPGVVNGTSGALFSAPKINPLLRGRDYYRQEKGQ